MEATIKTGEFWSNVGFWILLLGLAGDVLLVFVPEHRVRSERILAIFFTVIIALGCLIEHFSDRGVFSSVAKQQGEQRSAISSATTQITSLRETVEKLETYNAQRRLTDTQRAALIASILPFKGQVSTVTCIAGDTEGCTFANDFLSVLISAGWDVGSPPQVHNAFFSDGGDTAAMNRFGVQVSVNSMENVPSAAVALVHSLHSLDLIPGNVAFVDTGVPVGTIDVRIWSRPTLTLSK